MRIALAQTDIIWNEPIKNHARIQSMIDQAADDQADLIVLPEMFNTGFSIATGQVAKIAQQEGIAFLSQMASQHRTHIAGSLPYEFNGKWTNSFVLFGRGGEMLARYAKVHLIPAYKEDQSYERGTEVIEAKVGDLTISPSICYDLRFPYIYSSIASKVDAFIIIANWPAVRQQHWETLLRARAIENQCYVVAVNRVGSGGGLEFAGGSAVYSPTGETICHCGAEESLHIAEIEKGVVEELRTAFPVLSQRVAL